MVDNHSDDSTENIAKGFDLTFYRRGPERTAQVNYGIKQSCGEFVYIMNADFVLPPDLLERCVSRMRNCDALVIGNATKTSTLFSRIIALRRSIAEGDLLSVAPRFLRRSVFDAVGGYDEALVIGEDIDFFRRLVASSYRIGYCPDIAELNIGEPEHLTDYVMKQLYYGRFVKQYILKNNSFAGRQVNVLRFLGKSNRNPLIIFVIALEFLRLMSLGVGFLTVGHKSRPP